MKLFLIASMLMSASSFHVSSGVASRSAIKTAPRFQPLMASSGDDEVYVRDLPKVINVQSMKPAKEAYLAMAEKGEANAKMSKRKILHQSILGGMYVGFGGLLSLCIAGNMAGVGAPNPGLAKMAFAALFPVNLLLILTTGGQLFTGNSATVAAAKWEGKVEWRELVKSWSVSLFGNIIGCSMFALAAWYSGVLSGGAAALCKSTAMAKCSAGLGQTVVKAILCNWMVSLACFLAGASNDLAGKMVGIWFPISTFVAIGLEHSIANLFIMPAALLLKVPMSLGQVVMKNLFPVVVGNAIAGALVFAASYSFQFGKLGKNSHTKFQAKQAAYEARKQREREDQRSFLLSQLLIMY